MICGTPEPTTPETNFLPGGEPSYCTDPEVVKYIRVNLHWMLKADGTGNFNEFDDGQGNPYDGYQRAEDLIAAANQKWANNQTMWLPKSGAPAAQATRIRLVLTGVYFHRNDFQFADGSGSGNWAMRNQYGADPSSAINVFLLNTPAPRGESNRACGIGGCFDGGGLAVKMYTQYLLYQDYLGWSTDITSRSLNHELQRPLPSGIYYAIFYPQQAAPLAQTLRLD